MRGLSFGRKDSISRWVPMVIQTIITDFQPARDDGSLYTGGYFVLADAATGLSLLSYFVGEVSDERAVKYLEFAQEKAQRLSANLQAGHVLSWQSRNPVKDMWGGAYYSARGNCILSFSGLPEAWDEAGMLTAADRIFGTASEELAQAVSISGNSNFLPLARNLGMVP